MDTKRKMKSLFDTNVNSYVHILDEELFHCDTPQLLSSNVTKEELSRLLAPEWVEDLSKNCVLVSLDITQSEEPTLIEKLKLKVIEDLTSSEARLDDPCLIVGKKTYSNRDMAEEIRNETRFGIERLSSMIMLTLDLVSRNKEKLKEL